MNDLAFNPDADIIYGDYPQSIRYVHSIDPLKRWTGKYMLQRKTINIPLPIVSYNPVMVSVEIMDQNHQCTSVKRKEKNSSTDILNYVNILVCLNAHDVHDQLLLQKSNEGEKLSHTKFKILIAEQLRKG